MSAFLYKLYVVVRWLFQSIGVMKWIDRSPLFVKVARWMRERITGGQAAVITEPIDGHRMQINSDYIDLLKGGGYEKGTTRVFTEIISEGMCVVDIGANIGYYTLLAAKRVGANGRVYAFEPEPRNFKVLMENVQLNDYHNVTAIQKAVSNQAGTAQLYLGLRGSGAHSLLSSRDCGKDTIVIETVTMDKFFQGEGLPAIHLVKMDIEGWEIEALDGMRSTIMRNSPLNLIIEFYPGGLLSRNIEPMVLIDKLTELGLTISIIDEETGQITPFAQYHFGLIDKYVARHKTAINLLCRK